MTGRALLTLPDGYPEVLAIVARAVADELARRGQDGQAAGETGLAAAEAVRTHLGGGRVYIPTGRQVELSARDAEIWRDFNGRNYFELAKRHGLTEVQVRTIVNNARRRDLAARQEDLFNDQAGGRPAGRPG